VDPSATSIATTLIQLGVEVNRESIATCASNPVSLPAGTSVNTPTSWGRTSELTAGGCTTPDGAPRTVTVVLVDVASIRSAVQCTLVATVANGILRCTTEITPPE
jgi:hypothetical protein